jgi:hypothetical protein
MNYEELMEERIQQLFAKVGRLEANLAKISGKLAGLKQAPRPQKKTYKLVSRKEAAKIAGVGERAIYMREKNGSLRAYNKAGHRLPVGTKRKKFYKISEL